MPEGSLVPKSRYARGYLGGGQIVIFLTISGLSTRQEPGAVSMLLRRHGLKGNSSIVRGFHPCRSIVEWGAMAKDSVPTVEIVWCRATRDPVCGTSGRCRHV